jgi:ATP adenylyltransferase
MTSRLDHLWAGWRSAYIERVSVGAEAPSEPQGAPPGEGSLFERILRLPDEEGYVVHRGESCSTILNAYPYTNGHVLVMPNVAHEELDDFDEDTFDALWREVRAAVRAIRTAYPCDGVNVGLNMGRAAGAGVPEHLHVHAMPRWAGDTNFMTSVAEARVLPESLASSWQKLRTAWPS